MTQGAKADAAYAGSGSASVVAILKGLYSATTSGNIATGTPGTPATSQVLTVQGAASMTPVLTTPAAGTANGATPGGVIVPSGAPAGTSLKASAGRISSIATGNISATTPAYLKLYDTASAPTCGSGTPVARFVIPANSLGGGNNIQFTVPIQFNNGIGWCATGGIADNDTTALSAGTVLVNIFWN